MSNIPNAKPSPRIEHGCLYWYKDDTFSINIELSLSDQDGRPVPATGTVEVVFYDDCKNSIKTFECIPSDNVITLEFDKQVSSLFPIGEYRYDIHYTGQERVTIANENKAFVE